MKLSVFFVATFVMLQSSNSVGDDGSNEKATTLKSDTSSTIATKEVVKSMKIKEQCLRIDSLIDGTTGQTVTAGVPLNSTARSPDEFVTITPSCYINQSSNLVIRKPSLEKWKNVNLNFETSLYGSRSPEDPKPWDPKPQPRCANNMITVEFAKSVSYAKILAAVESLGYIGSIDSDDPEEKVNKEPHAFPGKAVFMHENNNEVIGKVGVLVDLGHDHPNTVVEETRGSPLLTSPLVKSIRVQGHDDSSNIILFVLCYKK
ncbi:MAG: hypothetical protein JAY63_18490 [Candidatus Thiodiazotropha taylori]|nr:hypothetical protein [Candidatus Thiodiazotropha taylori]